MPSAGLRVLGIVPARGGSKGVPGKNIRPLGGKPLLHYTADAARASIRLSHTILSTDDERIASVGRACGLAVPFLRPADLAADTTPMLPVVRHALEWFESRGDRFDAVCLLQPTSPFRRAADIDRCIERLEETGADSVVTVLPVPPEHNPHWVYFESDNGTLRLSTGEAVPIPRRQDLPPAFHREGSVYVSRRASVLERNSLYGGRTVGYLIDPAHSVNIDDEQDWQTAERLLRERER
ncbi:MAG: acylneuraminate cytidylyltransferase family protein [Vicinamibacterales bacterium]